jgi:hypothetical protein
MRGLAMAGVTQSGGEQQGWRGCAYRSFEEVNCP